MDLNANNGLITKIWGPPAWEFLHSITFGFPISPTPEQKEAAYAKIEDALYLLGKIYNNELHEKEYAIEVANNIVRHWKIAETLVKSKKAKFCFLHHYSPCKS